MGQSIVVNEKPSSNPGVVRFETNRAFTGMDHERYLAGTEVWGNRPPDELDRRLLAKPSVAGLHINGNMVTVDLAKGYSHVLAPATSFGKNVLPRVAALLDVAQISEIVAVHDADTFDRPIYAGNAIATVQSSDPVKIITVRGTAFDPAAAEGGSAAIESATAGADAGLSKFVGQELSNSERVENFT